MGRTIGIDLGTTNTAIAVVVDGRPRVLEDEKGYKVLPSCVSSKGEGRYVVGQAAKSLVLSAPERTVYAVKRLMGRHWDAPEVEHARERVAYQIEAGPDGGVRLRLGNETFSPQEISAIILQVARQIAERALGESVDEAVITVPAYFTHAQREATLEAARMAGLKCERLLNEPTAAALAYGYRRDLERTIVVFDLGGGTFDVCVLRIAGGFYEILATRGDSYLGGEDFDYRLVDHLADSFRAQHGVDLRRDRTSLQRLKDAAERAKCELSFTDRTTVLVPRISGNTNLEMVVSRATLESVVEDLVGRTVETTQRAVADAGLSVAQIDDVILVGGQARMPKVREAVSALFGREPNRSVHPEEVVAIGAAVHAASLEDGAAAGPILLDVTPFDLGIESAGGLFTPIITRNTKIPASRTRVFATVHDNQDRVRVTVRQGEHARAQENEFLGEFVLEGITPAPRMESRVNVTFRLDGNGMLHVQATEPATGERKQITIRNYAEVAARPSAGAAPGPKPVVEGDVAPAAQGAADRLMADLAPAPAPAQRKGLFGGLFKKAPAAPTPSAPASAPASSPVREVQLVEGPPEAPPPVAPTPAPPAEPPPIIAIPAAGPLPEAEPAASVPPLFDSVLLPMGDEDDAGDIEDYGGVEGLFEDRAGIPAAIGLAGEVASDPEPLALGDVDEVLPDEVLEEAAAAAGLDEISPEPPPDEEDEREITEPDLGEPPLDDLEPLPEPVPPPPPEPAPEPAPRNPARLRMNYRTLDALLAEVRENLARGGAFVRTPSPLPLGRECLFEIRAPGLDEPLQFPGLVTWSSRAAVPGPGQEPGMMVEYRMNDLQRARVDAMLAQARGA